MRVAVVSDIHGNSWALEAVLQDLKLRKADVVLNLGDVFFGPLDPAGTADLLQGLPWPTIQGNGDRWLFEEDLQAPVFQYGRSELPTWALRWLRDQPPLRTYEDEFYLCHGAPSDDLTYLLEEVQETGVFLRDGAAIEADLKEVEPGIVLCGHTHVARTVLLPKGKLVVNPGSVGLPAYTAEQPFFHAMESGSPHARYALITQDAKGWSVDHIAVNYPVDKAVQKALDFDRTDWARWLARGRD